MVPRSRTSVDRGGGLCEPLEPTDRHNRSSFPAGVVWGSTEGFFGRVQYLESLVFKGRPGPRRSRQEVERTVSTQTTKPNPRRATRDDGTLGRV